MTTRNRSKTGLTLAAVAMAILVLTTTSANATLRDGLVEFWALDGDYSAKADPSHVGTLQTTGTGSGVFVPGKFGQGIDLKNSVGNQAYVTIGGDENDFDLAGGSMSFSAWYTTRSLYAQYQCLLGKGENAAWRVARVTTSNTNMKLSVSGASGNGQIDKQDGSWHHVVGTYDATSGTRLYVDGSLVGSTTSAYSLANVATAMQIGGNPQASGRAWDGIIDDVAVWNRVLTVDEVSSIWNGGAGASIGSLTGLADSPKPLHPSPDNGATDVRRNVVLSWMPGIYASTHDVYLGTDRDDVNDASRNDPRDVLVSGSQVDVTYAPPVRLEFATTYYWRIDEVNAPPDSTIFKGMIWSFTTEPLAYPVARQSIKASASSSEPNQGPENTINSSGLANDLHSEELPAMWLTATDATRPAWIQYEFERVLRLDQMWVWNHNGLFEPAVGFGAKKVTIEYSTDGNDFKVLGTTDEFARAPGKAGYAHNTTVDFGGIAAKYVRLTINSNWGNILKQYGLSEVRFYSVPVYAREPKPVSGKTGVDVTSSVSWRAGREAAKHVLYMSKTQQAVIDGNVPAQTLTSPAYTPALDLAGTYYWRIDEANDTETPAVWPGDIWSLSTETYDVVDDFESYTNDSPKRVFQAWIDGAGFSPDPFFPQGSNGNGSGALVGYDPLAGSIMDTVTFHAGKKSMPLMYDNTTSTYSETKRTFSGPQDWTKHGVKALTLWFYGDPTNTAQQMYVKINSTKVAYDGAADNLKRQQWQMWYIPLASLSVGSVTSLSIGFDRLGTTGGAGKVLIDDFRLYSYDRQLITPKDPGTVGLQAQYQFEGNANDSSGKARNGTLAGAPTYAAGKSGQAISLDGVDDYVNIDGYKGVLADAAGVQQPFTVCAWIKTATDAMDIVTWGTNAGGQRMSFRVDTVIRVEHGNGNIRGTNGPSLLDDEWHHVAATVPQAGRMMDVRLYTDGGDATPASTTTAAFNIQANIDVRIGMGGPTGARFFKGLIDDVRIYDRVLSAEEIAWLAGRTIPFDKGF